MMKRIFMFIMAMMMFTVNVCADSGETEEVYKVCEFDIGDGITIYKNSDGKWGAYSNNFYLDANYYMPCAYYYDNYYAYDGTFVLALEDTYVLNDNLRHSNTYYVFNSSGEIIKTLTYSLSDIQEEKPEGYTFSWAEAVGAIGSNIVFVGATPYGEYNYSMTPYIKRLYSEKIAGEGYGSICVYKGVGFKAKEKTTGRKCILNMDGSFKEYADESD